MKQNNNIYKSNDNKAIEQTPFHSAAHLYVSRKKQKWCGNMSSEK